MRKRDSLFDIVAALGLFILSGVAAGSGAALLPEGLRISVVVTLQGVLALVVVGALLAWRRQRWSDIGLSGLRLRDLARGALAFAACLGANVVLVYALYGASPETVEMHSERLGSLSRQFAADMSLPWLVVVLGFVGVYEEVFARGFLLTRCRSLVGGTWGPVLISSLLFGLGHLYQGWIGVGQTTLIGVVLAFLTLRWGTLWPAIIAHALLDIVSMVMMGALGGAEAATG